MYTNFDYPGQSYTQLTSVNNNGDVAGIIGSPLSFSGQSSFLANLEGVPGPSFSVPLTFFTYAQGIDNTGQVIGGVSAGHVFLRSPSGVISFLTLPPGVTGISSEAISENGRIGLSANDSLYFATGGSYVQAVVPGAGSSSNAANLMGIDNSGNSVGFYFPDGGDVQSFFRDAGGSYQSIFFHGSQYTEIEGMNDLGQSVGFFYDGTAQHGVLGRRKHLCST